MMERPTGLPFREAEKAYIVRTIRGLVEEKGMTEGAAIDFVHDIFQGVSN